MSNIPTATGLIRNKYPDHNGVFVLRNIEEFMIEFAELHVQAALKYASEHYAQGSLTPGKGVSIKDAILNAYPLSNIK